MRKKGANKEISSSSSGGVKVDSESVAVPRSREEWVNFFNQISQQQNKNNNSDLGKSVIVEPENSDNVEHLQMDPRAMGGDSLSRGNTYGHPQQVTLTLKLWNTLIGDPYLKMMGKLSAEERMDCALNIMCYVLHLVGLFSYRKAYLKEIMNMFHLPLYEKELLGYDYGSFLHPLVDDDTEDEGEAAQEHDNEEVEVFEYGDGLEYDDDAEDNEEVDDDESGDGPDNDDDGKKGKLSVEEMVNSTDNILHTLCYIVPMVEGLYKDKKADLKEAQDRYPLSRHARQLLGYDSWSDVHRLEHDSKEVNGAKSTDGVLVMMQMMALLVVPV